MPEIEIPANILVYSRRMKKAWGTWTCADEGTWRPAGLLTTNDFVATPADMGTDVLPTDTSHIPDIASYTAAHLLSLSGIRNKHPFITTDEIMKKMGWTKMMLDHAVMAALLVPHKKTNELRPSPDVETIYHLLMDGSESISCMSWASKVAICRGWMENPAASTQSQSAILLMARLMRSIHRSAVMIETLKRPPMPSLYTISLHEGSYRFGLIHERGMGWSRVLKTPTPLPQGYYCAMKMDRDDSRVLQGIYVRDSHMIIG
jgi:hypothetical protein